MMALSYTNYKQKGGTKVQLLVIQKPSQYIVIGYLIYNIFIVGIVEDIPQIFKERCVSSYFAFICFILSKIKFLSPHFETTSYMICQYLSTLTIQ